MSWTAFRTAEPSTFMTAMGRLSYELSLRADGSEGSQTRRFYEADGSYTEEFTVDEHTGAADGMDTSRRLERRCADRARQLHPQPPGRRRTAARNALL